MRKQQKRRVLRAKCRKDRPNSRCRRKNKSRPNKSRPKQKAGGRSGVRVCIEEKSGDKTGVRRTEKSGDKKRSRQSGESRIAKETGIERKYGSGQFGSDGKGDGFDENFTDRAAEPKSVRRGRKRKKSEVKKQSAKNEARAASDSIYLTVRSSAVTLDKASGVKVGNVKTQLPDGYEGYIRRTAKCETNLGSDVFTAEGGPLDGREDCKTLTAKDKNKYYAWYRKGMYYQGKWVDIKVTLVDFELRDGAFSVL